MFPRFEKVIHCFAKKLITAWVNKFSKHSTIVNDDDRAIQKRVSIL